MPDLPEVHKIYPGTVERIASFGAFVSILGFSKDGLLHISQLANSRVDKVEDVVAVGDRLFVKVIGLTGDDPENPKISLSIKTVNQSTGADLDPTNLVAAQDDKAKKGDGARFDRPKIELGAVYNVKCTKCGAKGHLAKMCMAGGAEYSLVDEPEDEAAESAQSAIDREFERHRRKLEKNAKKQLKAREAAAEAARFDMQAYMAAGEAAVGSGGKKKKEKKDKRKKDKKSKKGKKRKKHSHDSGSGSGSDSGSDDGEGRPSKAARA